jgi:hypothetical protein
VGALAEILRRHGPAYRARFAARMPADQLRAMRAIETCRTAALGGRRWQCPRCARTHWAFHSCGNRHCPACGGDDAREWLRRQEALLLPARYHLCTFTMPEELRRLIRSHPRAGLAILFAASSSALLDVCANPKWLGARPGLTGVLHTNGRSLAYHPHVHYVATGGGLAPDGTWREAHGKFLVPVRALSALFRARFRDELRRRLPEVFAAVPAKTWRRDWVVHSQPVGDGKNALRYLSRYVCRVALADSAIGERDGDSVAFRYRDSQTKKVQRMKLPAMEFIRRFLQHVLPSGFVKVRHYGLHHPRRRDALALVRATLCLRKGLPIPAAPEPDEPLPPPRCPRCDAPMEPRERTWRPIPSASVQPLAHARGPPAAP